jgi:hypothetical protein
MALTFGMTYVGLWILVLFEGLLMLVLLRQLEQLQRVLDRGGFTIRARLPTGTSAPEFETVDARTRARVSRDTFGGAGGILLFLSPDCATCKDLATTLGRSTSEDDPRMVFVCQGDALLCHDLLIRIAPGAPAILDPASTISSLYRVSSFPTAVVLDGALTIRSYAVPKHRGDLTRIMAEAHVLPQVPTAPHPVLMG